MTDLNETDSNTNNDIDNDTKGDIANSSSDIDTSTANENENNINTNTTNGEIDTPVTAISTVSDTGDTEQGDGEMTSSEDDTTSDAGKSTDVVEYIETKAEADVVIATEADTATTTEVDTTTTTEADTPTSTEAATEAKDEKSSKSNAKAKHEPSYDVIYEGEITVPMDVDVLITGLIVKHNHYIGKYQAEFDTLDPVIGEIMPKLEAAKKGRDEINERIVVLKEKRRQLYHQAKGMRTEMYKLMDIDNDLKSAPIESKKIRDEIEELDWTLQTTQMSTSKERDIVKNIRILDAKLHTMDSDVDREAEVSTKISELKETLTATMDEANSAHEEIMSIADESQKFHEEYIKYNEVARGSGGRHKWLSARITSHREALMHWTERQQAGGVANV